MTFSAETETAAATTATARTDRNAHHRILRPQCFPEKCARFQESARVEHPGSRTARRPRTAFTQKVEANPQELPGHARIFCDLVSIHAQAGLYAADDLGTTASVLASDVLNSISDVISDLE